MVAEVRSAVDSREADSAEAEAEAGKLQGLLVVCLGRGIQQ